MIEGDKNIKLYSVTDIQKYLDGKLSVTEMYDFEKAAMEDPMLADALEGVQSLVHANEPFETGIDDLTSRLQLRIAEENNEENKIAPLPDSPNRLWWRAAAALIILLAVSALTFTYLVNRKSPAGNIAILKQKAIPDSKEETVPPKPESTASVATPPVTQPADSSPVLAVRSAKQHRVQAKKSSSLTNQAVADQLKNIATEKTAVREFKSDTLPFASALPTPKSIIQPERVLEGKVAGLQIESRASTINSIQGRVVDANMQPIAGATVSYKNMNKSVSTDKNGEFKFVAKDSNARVRVNAVGFQPLSTTMKRFDANLIQLQAQSSALSEVVVSGSGNRRKQEAADVDSMVYQNGYFSSGKVTVLKAMPATGWRDFNNYLAVNKKIFTADSTIKGRETLSFTVDKNGRKSSFQIDNSLSPAHDAEAIRLIKEGPAWKLLKGKKARVTVSIEF